MEKDFVMNKIAIVILASVSFFSANALCDVTATATANWDASATKDTTSALVVTPLKSLTFQYVEGLEVFNTQKGAFDVSIEGQSGATDFELTSQIIYNTLTRTTDTSTLDVGVSWNGKSLSKSAPLTLIDTSQSISSGLDSLALKTAYAGSDRKSALGNFDFTIESASDGTDPVEFKDLADGYWSGDVKVQFTAVWTVST
jgi:hypothetical protein